MLLATARSGFLCGYGYFAMACLRRGGDPPNLCPRLLRAAGRADLVRTVIEALRVDATILGRVPKTAQAAWGVGSARWKRPPGPLQPLRGPLLPSAITRIWDRHVRTWCPAILHALGKCGQEQTLTAACLPELLTWT